MLAAKSDHELLVSLLLAGLVEHAHVCLTTVEGLAGLTETTGETVVDEGDLEDTLQGVENGHGARLGGVCCHLDLLGRGDLLGLLFSVRLQAIMLVVVCLFRGDGGHVQAGMQHGGVVCGPFDGSVFVGIACAAMGAAGRGLTILVAELSLCWKLSGFPRRARVGRCWVKLNNRVR